MRPLMADRRQRLRSGCARVMTAHLVRELPVCAAALLAMLLLSAGPPHHASAAQDSTSATQDDKTKPAEYKTVSLRGKVVWLSDALQRRFGIEVDPDARQQEVALETTDGRLIPLVKDFRGRGFHTDERLRDVPMELQLRIYKQSPAAQVVQVYTVHDGHKYELDYWCDICAIPMYELKACECCQGPTRLRERQVDEDK